ncbi:molybdopterin synthase catalytic subunit [Clavibacter michiganensis]|uniref:molybdenum cofactor biosynthesis protein MoaE n=1 Tax=Clavibacter michiganensis TaxID=28447 RepID=UPI001D4472E4|nr:molybdopterin synthase catalytic subunit [Clavibacter michiganensis]
MEQSSLIPIGRLGIGDVALPCAVSSAHRADAFAVCGLLVDEVTQRVPIWKQQAFDDDDDDGASEWVASLG